MRIHSKLLIFLVIFIVLFSLLGFSQELTESEKAMFSKNVLVPSPGDLFLALSKMGNVNWSEVASYNKRYNYDDNYARALNLGVRGADGFLAIQAEDKAQLGETIKTIIQLAENLGASDKILSKRRIIENLAKTGKWHDLRMELDKIQDDVKLEMIQQGDVDTAVLISAGGWINGLRATSKILSEKYNAENSTILFQPSLVEYFNAKFLELDKKAKEKPVINKIAKAIPEIRSLISIGYKAPIPKENIQKLYEISSQLVKEIEEG